MSENLPFNLPEFNLEEIKDDGSTNLGTFKSVKTLKDAYDSLRSCFTKNAMELAEIKKNMSQTDQNNKNTDIKAELFAKQDNTPPNSLEIDKKGENTPDLNAMRAEISQANEQEPVQNSQSDKVPAPDTLVSDKASAPENENSDKAPAPERPNFLDNADWTKRAEKFFDSFPTARAHTKEIAEALAKDKNFVTNENSLLTAWAKVLEQNRYNVELTDDFIEKNIVNNQKIKDLIIKNYLNNIKSFRSAPPVIASNEGTTAQGQTHTQPRDMAEAKELAKKLFE